MTIRRRIALLCASLATLAFASREASAQELSLDKLQIHGYGGWSFGRSTDNRNT